MQCMPIPKTTMTQCNKQNAAQDIFSLLTCIFLYFVLPSMAIYCLLITLKYPYKLLVKPSTSVSENLTRTQPLNFHSYSVYNQGS